jgi:hypothetical protein
MLPRPPNGRRRPSPLGGAGGLGSSLASFDDGDDIREDPTLRSDREIEAAQLQSARVSLPPTPQLLPLSSSAQSSLLSESDGSDARIGGSDSDVVWSILSNVFFVGGGLCYVVGTAWDWTVGSSLVDAAAARGLHSATWVLGPLVYLLNSAIDVAWALRSLHARRRDRQLRAFYRCAAGADAAGDDGDADQHQRRRRRQRGNKNGGDVELALKKWREHAAMDSSLLDGAIRISRDRRRSKARRRPNGRLRVRPILRRLRRHMGHRRELSAAATFGVAATFGLTAALLDLSGTVGAALPARLDSVSIHMYLVSAVFALCGARRSTSSPGAAATTGDDNPRGPLWGNAEALESVGDAFFGIASIIDVALCDLSFDDDVLWWPVVAASLWLLDAFFYLRADFVTLYILSSRRDDEESSVAGDAGVWHGLDITASEDDSSRPGDSVPGSEESHIV